MLNHGYTIIHMAAPISVSPNFCELPVFGSVTLHQNRGKSLENNQLDRGAPPAFEVKNMRQISPVDQLSEGCGSLLLYVPLFPEPVNENTRNRQLPPGSPVD